MGPCVNYNRALLARHGPRFAHVSHPVPTIARAWCVNVVIVLVVVVVMVVHCVRHCRCRSLSSVSFVMFCRRLARNTCGATHRKTQVKHNERKRNNNVDKHITKNTKCGERITRKHAEMKTCGTETMFK